MTGADVIKQVQYKASEWLEMEENPDKLMIGILANEVAGLKGYIEYLEKRLKNEISSNVRVN